MTAANGGSLDPSGNPGVSGDAGVLYVQLPEGHPVITGGTADEGIVQNSDTVLPGDTCTHPYISVQASSESTISSYVKRKIIPLITLFGC